MGQIIHSIISLVLLLIFVSFGKSLEDHQYSFEFDEINIADIVEAVETVETITKEMEIIAEILPQSDMIETCRIILKSSGIIGDLIGIGFDFYFPEKNPVIEKLDETTQILVKKLDEIGNQIDKATQEIKAFIEDNTFQKEITFLVNQLMNHITMFYTHRTPQLKYKLNQTCQEYSVESIFINMKTLLDSNAITNQLKSDDYSVTAFQRIESVYKNMTKQLLVAFPICDILVFGGPDNETTLEKRSEHIVAFVSVIEEKLKEENEERQTKLQSIQEWDSEVKGLKTSVEYFKQRNGNGWEVETIYGVSKCKEHFAILITHVIRHAVRIFTQKRDTLCSTYGDDENRDCWKENHYWTENGAKQVAQEWKYFLENGQYSAVRND